MLRSGAFVVFIAVLLIAGCARAPKQPLTENDCQVEAAGGSLQTEVSSVFEAQASGRTGGVTVRNVDKCNTGVRTFTRTENSAACTGNDNEWCKEALKAQPISLTPEQIGELMRQFRDAETDEQ